MWDNICRLCSSKGDYDIFAMIPFYLHANPHERTLWQKPINKLLEETTGLSITQGDGLPNKVCALCISYLKHAATFRQQAINNAVNLKAILTIEHRMGSSRKDTLLSKGALSENIFITPSDPAYNDDRKTDTNRLVNILNNQNSKVTKDSEFMKKPLLFGECKSKLSKVKNESCSNTDDDDNAAIKFWNAFFEKDISSPMHNTKQLTLNQELNASSFYNEEGLNASNILNEEFQTASSDENDTPVENTNVHSLKEVNFEEDDIMDTDEVRDADIIITFSEKYKERKCRACFRRFMFEDSFKEHIEMCTEHKLLVFIEESNRLLDARRCKTIPPHEYIRRMILAFRKACQWLEVTSGESINEQWVNEEAKKKQEMDTKNSTAEVSSGGNSDEAGIKIVQSYNKSNTKKNIALNLESASDAYFCYAASTNLRVSDSNKSQNGAKRHTPLKPTKFENAPTLLENTPTSRHKSRAKSNNLLSQDGIMNETLESSDAQFPRVFETLENVPKVKHPTNSFLYNQEDPQSMRCNMCDSYFGTSLETHNVIFHKELISDHKRKDKHFSYKVQNNF